jgi:hypothetical protein
LRVHSSDVVENPAWTFLASNRSIGNSQCLFVLIGIIDSNVS